MTLAAAHSPAFVRVERIRFTPAEKAIVQRSAFAGVPDPVCKAARQYLEQYSVQTALPH